MEDHVYGVVPCSSFTIESIILVGTAGAIRGLCSGPYDARKQGFTGLAQASFVANVGRFGFQCEQEGDVSGRSKQSRSEKKSRKAMLKLGMKPVTGVSRVTVKKSKNIEDLSSQLQTQAAKQFKAPNLSNVGLKHESSAMAKVEGDGDETGVDPKDIELVMTQAGVSRPKVVKALNATNRDIVAAIMELTNLMSRYERKQ